MVWAFDCYQKSGNSNKYKSLGSFPLSEAKNLKEYNGAGCLYKD